MTKKMLLSQVVHENFSKCGSDIQVIKKLRTAV